MRCSSWPSCQAVCMDSESLPTGMATDSERLMSLAASTAARRAASWPGVPAAAIQLAESLTCESLRTLVPARLVRASPMAMRAEARSEEHTSELQSRGHLVCRLLLEKK